MNSRMKLKLLFIMIMDEEIPDTWDDSDCLIILKTLTGTIEDIIEGTN